MPFFLLLIHEYVTKLLVVQFIFMPKLRVQARYKRFFFFFIGLFGFTMFTSTLYKVTGVELP